jgi:hypothetical protein
MALDKGSYVAAFDGSYWTNGDSDTPACSSKNFRAAMETTRSNHGTGGMSGGFNEGNGICLKSI